MHIKCSYQHFKICHNDISLKIVIYLPNEIIASSIYDIKIQIVNQSFICPNEIAKILDPYPSLHKL